MALYKSLYDRLENQYETIWATISHIDHSRIHLHPSPQKWSIHDNIVHLAKYQPIFLARIHTILNKNTPVFERYKAENDPEFETWRKYDMTTLLKTLHYDRKDIFNTIISLNEAELNLIGIHKKFGKLTVTQWTEFFLLHEAHHIFTIFQLANDVEIK